MEILYEGYCDCGFVFVWMDGGKMGYVLRGLLIFLFFISCFVLITRIICIVGVDGETERTGESSMGGWTKGE